MIIYKIFNDYFNAQLPHGGPWPEVHTACNDVQDCELAELKLTIDKLSNSTSLQPPLPFASHSAVPANSASAVANGAPGGL